MKGDILRKRRGRMQQLKKVFIISICIIFVLGVGLNLIFTTFDNLMIETSLLFFMDLELPGLYVLDEQEPPISSFQDIISYFLLTTLQIDKNSPEQIVGLQFSPINEYSHEIQAMAETTKDKESEPSDRDESGTAPAIVESKIQEPEIIESENGKVGIYHSHTTESFVPTTGEPFVENLDKTVVRLGRKMVSELEQLGISAVHTEEIHDLPTRHESYSRSKPTVEQMLEEHSDIDVLLDLHRDGVPRDMTTAEINGEKVGKILILVGSGEDHPNWRENYQFALKLQKELEKIHPDLSRGIRTRNFSYNQELHSRALLIEIGGHENSLEETMRTIPYFTEAIERAISR
ncbi:stage II sporulation protein P [Natranaerobius trueperi]|uniref:Stage II sporulation protein P n=1 Tax=Natranaerobius trueperi TaxID=759412 RepID=A0A226BYB7_9FIRM|nr:stage II sporulation protein P [Natranaerobius trueperi]OWZ83130.1 hypothetical protein CDO51_10190 [Natranaerobius trueperi]